MKQPGTNRQLAGLTFKATIIPAIVGVMALLSMGCGGGVAPPGTIEGTVKVGPLVPVERPGITPRVPPQAFEARKVMIYDELQRDVTRTVDIQQVGDGPTGRYRVELPPGTYVVDINRLGIDRSGQLPRKVTLAPGEVVTLNIDIDTGIR